MGPESAGEAYRAQRDRVKAAFERFRAEYTGDVYDGDQAVFMKHVRTDKEIEMLWPILERHKASYKFSDTRYVPSVRTYFEHGYWCRPPKENKRLSMGDRVRERIRREGR